MNVFFFKKKTEYEMRISDWSSDVCSSYLKGCDDQNRNAGDDETPRRPCECPAADRCFRYRSARRHVRRDAGLQGAARCRIRRRDREKRRSLPRPAPLRRHALKYRRRDRGRLHPGATLTPLPLRSEEHTSDLQSLMRISYAVFCLKK